MRLTFLFTDQPDLPSVSPDERFVVHFALPDVAIEHLETRTTVLNAGELLGRLTEANLHVHCPELGLQYQPIKQSAPVPTWGNGLLFATRTAEIKFFRRHTYSMSIQRQALLIHKPVRVDLPHQKERPLSLSFTSTKPTVQTYLDNVRTLSTELVGLLNLETIYGTWQSDGFFPERVNNQSIKRMNNTFKIRRVAQKQQDKQAEKQQEQALQEPVLPSAEGTHKAGAKIGARPGKYRNVQMRSQLEIRFAAELDERHIRWLYESEVVGESGYLVDFYLPDLNTWVEVKGKFEARDRQVLPSVAELLRRERNQRLFVYTASGVCFIVNSDAFQAVERKDFWNVLSSLP